MYGIPPPSTPVADVVLQNMKNEITQTSPPNTPLPQLLPVESDDDVPLM